MKNQHLSILIVCLLAAILFSCNPPQLEETDPNLILPKIANQKPMNVVFILADDHRYDFMGFLNKPAFLETPNMDRMAAEGMHFPNASVSTSLCSPSRASILTGQYTHHHTVVDNSALEPDNLIYFPQYLQEAGYATAFFGKWHMGNANDNPRKGFDKWVSFKGQGDYYDPTLNIDGERQKVEGYNADLLTGYATDWLTKERDKEKPFFLYLSHKAVHAMFQPAQRHLDKYVGQKIEYPISYANTDENYKGKPAWVREQRNSWHGVDYMYHGQLEFDSFYYKYCETILGVDESIGTVIKTLEENNLEENTMVIYMGDNGFVLGEHGLIDKRHAYEESMKVPFLAYAPGLIKGGQTVNEQVQNIDVAPTILAAAGLETPASMDGKSFLPLLKGEKMDWPDVAFYEYYWEKAFPQTPTTFAIRTDQYKFIQYHGVWGDDELYDLKKDPQEMNNLFRDPAYKTRVDTMRSQIYTWQENTNGMLIPLKRGNGWSADKRRGEE
ncbi:MAG: N-acetylglucosamine-6-sulfatase [Saprospiraceae bacterium]|jgi:N-acetylglucosamine-6-sulfatase